MTTLKVQSTAAALALGIRQEIIEGKLSAGDPLPQEELAARYGVSRSPLREALRQLESEGWIDYHPNRGAVVALVSAKDVREIYQVRRILEIGALELALPKITKERIKLLRELDASLHAARDHRDAVRLHLEFHQAVYAVLDNPRLLEAIQRHYVRIFRLPNAPERIAAVLRCSKRDHRPLLQALAAGDLRAAKQATIAHLDHMEAIMLEVLS